MFNEKLSQFKRKGLILAATTLCAFSLTACNSDSNPDPQPEPEIKATTGIWSAPAYGLVVDITDNDYSVYQLTSDTCQVLQFSNMFDVNYSSLISSINVSDDQNSMITSLAGLKTPGIVMNKQSTLPDSCTTELIKKYGDENYVFDAEAELNIFAQTFEEYYAFFNVEQVDWDETYQVALNAVQVDTTEEELFSILAAMVAPLKDFHVDLSNQHMEAQFNISRKPDLEDIAIMDFIVQNEISPPFSPEKLIDFPGYYEAELDKAFTAILSHASDNEEIHSNNNESIIWSKIDNNIGYLMLKTMDDGAIGNAELSVTENLEILAATMDAVLIDLAGVDGLIIDVRFNDGGTDKVPHYIVGRLIESDLVALSKQARLGEERTPLQNLVLAPQGTSQFVGPIALLTSTTTASAAEIFALMMRARPNTVLVGESSAGGFSDQLVRTLPHGLLYTISNEFYVSSLGEEFEGVGVPVNIEQAFFTLEQRDTGVDLGLNSAINWLTNQ